MNNRMLIFMVSMVLVAIGLMLGLNILTIFQEAAPSKYLSPNEVRGMATEHNKLLYTLNFEQQNRAVILLNRAIRVGYQAYTEHDGVTFDFDKLVVYRFNEPEITIIPISVIKGQMVFSCPEWNPDGLLRETGPGELKDHLDQTYDP